MIHSAVLVRPPRLTLRRDDEQDARSISSEELAQWALEGAIRVRCHHFLFVTLRCADVRQLYDVFATMKHLACVSSLKRLYAFDYRPEQKEEDVQKTIYDAHTEFRRMGVGLKGGVGQHWRVSEINRGFQLCATYPPVVAVPARISDTTLTYAARYRSKARLPVLSYLHTNGASMTRSSQPMVGLKQARSVQDEKLVEAILATSEPDGTPPRFRYERDNIIIDARPTTNAVVNRAVGAGSENMDHYRRCRKAYLGIDNIHVMRDALNRMADAVQSEDQGEAGVVARIQSSRSSWLGHLQNILVGAKTIVEAIDAGNHVLVHCSDGWDRTAQLTSLAQLCLDPYYRTIEGFSVLVEKEWVSFGHQFTLRSGHLGHPDRFTVVRAGRKRAPERGSEEDEAEDSNRDNVDDDGASASGEVPEGDLLQAGSSMFGRFATRAFRGVQSRITSALQAASDNLDDIDDVDPFFSEYPELQPNYVPPPDVTLDRASSTAQRGFRLGRSKHDRETSPVFQQFLDCVYQLWVQHPTMFEFNEKFLLDLFYHLHTAQFGTFLGNNMKERAAMELGSHTTSVWSLVDSGDRSEYLNALYRGDETKREQRVVVPDPRFVQYWSALFSCYDPAFAKISDRESRLDSQSDSLSESLSVSLPQSLSESLIQSVPESLLEPQVAVETKTLADRNNAGLSIENDSAVVSNHHDTSGISDQHDVLKAKGELEELSLSENVWASDT
ncbi:phosphatidylinositol-3-phosphatase ymr1 [Coemansia erecta]|nr:phosphatidylinositol-3-phosphatase ymr1 [Coemansia erecta]